MSATLVVAGDLSASGRVGAVLSRPGADSVWSDIVSVTRAADFSVVNLECALSDRPDKMVKSGPRLWAPTRCAPGIRAAGFSAVSLANNHVLDAGPGGLLHTIKACSEAGLLLVGAGKDHESATTPLTVALDGFRLSVLAFAENEFSTTTGPRPGAWPLDPIDNAVQIASARRESDYVLVLLHGGVEHYPLPSPRMQKTCRFFVDQGADAVICHHTHVVGGNESYKDRPIVYGTGNLLFDTIGEPGDGWFTGCMVLLRVARHETLGVELIPCRQDPAEPSVRMIMGPEREAVLSHIVDLSGVVADPKRLGESWAAFSRTRRTYLLGSMLCLTQPESWLFDKGLLPTAGLRLTQSRLARLQNLFTCESHAESCEQVLHDMLEERDSPS